MNSDAAIYWVSGKQIMNITVQKLMFMSKQTCGMRGLIKETQTEACRTRDGRQVQKRKFTKLTKGQTQLIWLTDHYCSPNRENCLRFQKGKQMSCKNIYNLIETTKIQLTF